LLNNCSVGQKHVGNFSVNKEHFHSTTQTN